MPHVLFITEKYHSGPQFGFTNNIYNLIGSYECSGYGTYKHVFIDPEDVWSSQGVDDALLNNEYDMAVISVYHHLPSQEVATKIGYKTWMCWWDSIISMGAVHPWSSKIHQACFDWGKGEEFPNTFCVEVPQDTRIFYRDKSVVKDIDISFVGSITSYWTDRGQAVQKIRDAGFNVWAGGGRGPGLDNLPIEEYANIFRRSKICLNLSYGHGRPQRKGRSFEIAASGGFMMTNCPEMFSGKDGKWFEDGIDYVSFHDGNLIDQVRYHLDRQDIRDRVEESIYEKYYANYAPKPFWKKMLNTCWVEV
jgi:hypothetical protein